MAGESTRATRGGSGVRGMSVGGTLTLSVLPLLLLTVVLAGLLIWQLIANDTTAGLSMMEILAIVLGAVVAGVVVLSLWRFRRRTGVITARIGEVTSTLRRLAREDLTHLGESLDDPDPSLAPIAPIELNPNAHKEIAELSESLDELHGSLEHVAARQMRALKGGVSGLIVSLARRNATLVDRQLALLDELEQGERDPDVLGTYYMVDHYATRIRRNAESLLVLAGEPPPRVWPRSIEISEVVRSAVGEVDDYERIEIVSVERAQVAGGVVSDLAHLLAEVLDNATRFSPPATPVTVKSVADWDGYRITISDRGPGMNNERIKHLNQTLKFPPALGRVMEPAMGMYVVARLAARHGMKVEILPGFPGLIVQVTIPSGILEHSFSEGTASYRDLPRPHSRTGDRGMAVKTARVVDLTDPEIMETHEDSHDGAPAPTELPVRSPGRALGEAMAPPRPVAEAESAFGIRSALAAYDRGRRAAHPGPESQSADDEATGGSDE